jgi:hypothetical protein
VSVINPATENIIQNFGIIFLYVTPLDPKILEPIGFFFSQPEAGFLDADSYDHLALIG